MCPLRHSHMDTFIESLLKKKIHHASAISYILEKGKLRYTETEKFAQVSQKQVAES